jgi:hypothetical protein
VVLYESLTGVNPFQCEELTATLYQVVQGDPPPVRQRNPAVPEPLERVTARALAKEPDQRYPTAGALAAALAGALEPGAAAPTTGSAPRARGRRRRRLAAAAGLLLTAGLAGWLWWGPAGGAVAPAGRPAGGAVGLESPLPGVAAPARPAVPPVARPGEIVVETNPSVDVFVDGAPRGRTGEVPLVIRDVPPGDRLVTLRLGARWHEVSGTVPEGQALRLAYRFPEEARQVPLDKLLEQTGERIIGSAREKLREVLPEGLRDLAREKPSGGRPRPPAGGDVQTR